MLARIGGFVSIAVVVAAMIGPLQRDVVLGDYAVRAGWLVIMAIPGLVALAVAATLPRGLRGAYALSASFRCSLIALVPLIFVARPRLPAAAAVILTLSYSQVVALFMTLTGSVLGSGVGRVAAAVHRRRWLRSSSSPATGTLGED